MITSRTNQQLKKVRKLLSSGRERKESGLFVIEGTRLCMDAPAELLETVFLADDYKGRRPENLAPEQILVVERSLFRELSDTVNPQGILAVARQPVWDVKPASLKGTPGEARILLLDGIRDPGNMGTILRTAEAAGVRVVYTSPDCVDRYNPKVIRSTMGSIFRVPVVTVQLLPVIRQLQQAGIAVYGTSLNARKTYRQADLKGAAVIIGSEAEGISREVSEAADDNLLIPMHGQVESLNAAVSAAILLFC